MKMLKQKRSRFSISMLLILLVVFALPGLALADATLKLTNTYGIPATSVTVYSRAPMGTVYLETLLTNTTMEAAKITAEGDGSYLLTAAGTYSYLVDHDGYYRVWKVFNVLDAQVTGNETITMELETAPYANTGYEPGNKNLANAPANYVTSVMDGRDKILSQWPAEILQHIQTDTLIGFTPFDTPAFRDEATMGKHQVTSQAQMMAFVKEIADQNAHVHMFMLGKSPTYDFDIPLLVVTTETVPAGATLDDVAKILRDSGKVNVWHQGQIHPNEPASGEGALVMLQEMAGAYGASFLDRVNFISVPRINPEGSYLFTRAAYGGFDMNRDHMMLQAVELSYIHNAFSKVLPHVALDGHEMHYFGTNSSGRMDRGDDVEVTPASSLNNDADVNVLAMDKFAVRIHSALAGAGLRNNHYQGTGYTVNNVIGRAYIGLHNTVSILIETPGIGGGRNSFARRIFSHVTTVKTAIETSALFADEIIETVAAARQEVIDKGATYDEGDKLALYQTASGNTRTPYLCKTVYFDLQGNRTETALVTQSMNDTIQHSRTRPTAYIVPKSVDAAMLNLEWLEYIMDSQGFEYYELEPGTEVSAQQYYRTGAWTGNTPSADLRPEADVTFEDGTYVIPMDQVAGNVIAMLFEPDVRDSNNYNGTLVQAGLMTHDATTSDYPLYRFIQDNPREVLGLNVEEPHHGGGGSSNCSALGVGGLLSLLMIGAGIPLLARKRGK